MLMLSLELLCENATERPVAFFLLLRHRYREATDREKHDGVPKPLLGKKRMMESGPQ
jgi:hypothetical protein